MSKAVCNDCRYQQTGWDGGFFGEPMTCECKIYGVTEGRKSCSKFKKKVTKADLLKKICSLKKENEQLRQKTEELKNRKRIEEIAYCVKGNVKLRNGEWLELSDKLRIQGVVANKGDTAIIKDFPKKSVVVDIIKKKEVKEEVSEEELQKQIKQFNRLQGGY